MVDIVISGVPAHRSKGIEMSVLVNIRDGVACDCYVRLVNRIISYI